MRSDGSLNFQPFECELDSGLHLRGWRTVRPHQPVLFFLHGNGLCGRIYEPFLSFFEQHFELVLLDIAGHGASDAPPHFPGWNTIAKQCAEVVQRVIGDEREALMMGHSFGGILSILIAAAAPGRFKQLLLLDPILFPRRMLLVFTLMKWLRLTDRVHPMVRMTQKRRRQWPCLADALTYFQSRGAFEKWHAQALVNYVEYGLRDNGDGKVSLCCDPSLEATIFATWPRGLWRSIRDLRDSTTIFMGAQTFGFALQAATAAQRCNPNIANNRVEGNHFFMLEQPGQAAEQVLAKLKNAIE